ncbi:MAG: response regulator [Spirochaetes bacterium]|nr:response regulator [Spirochaetota bacterium]
MDNKIKRILVVDDEVENIDVLYNILKNDYEVQAAKTGNQALKLAIDENPPDLILLDIMMPGMNGFDVCKKLKASYHTKEIPVIFVTAKGDEVDETKGFNLGAVDYITKPIRPSVVLTRIKTHLSLFNQQKHLEYLVKERTRELVDTRLKIIHRLGVAGEFKDNETGMHVIRMSKYAQILGLGLGMSNDESELLLNVVPMHDIGKIGIPDRILLKPGKLDEEEWKIMKSHTRIGAAILGDDHSEIIREAKSCALTHHEKWDGTGYPDGLKEKEIPLYGRIAAVTDVFDALTSERPYKSAWSIEKAVNYLKKEKARHFEPRLIDIFVEMLPKILEVKEQFIG